MDFLRIRANVCIRCHSPWLRMYNRIIYGLDLSKRSVAVSEQPRPMSIFCYNCRDYVGTIEATLVLYDNMLFAFVVEGDELVITYIPERRLFGNLYLFDTGAMKIAHLGGNDIIFPLVMAVYDRDDNLARAAFENLLSITGALE